MSDLALRGICKSYQHGVPALAPLDLTVDSGQFVVLVGPSGCGKSTLLRLVAGLEQPTAGSIFLGSRDITKVPAVDRDIAMVFQGYALYPHMSVSENIGFGLRMRDVPKAERIGAIREVATQLELQDLLDRKPGQLSGGQRQRVALARAIVRRPKLFLFDEPLSNLDAALRATTRVELRRLHQRLRATTLYVTHDQVEAMSMADRMVVMRAGKVEQAGTPLEIYRQPANRFVATFIGSPPMKLLRATVDSGMLLMAGKRWPLVSQGVSGPLYVGFRAEHVAIEPQPNSATIPGTILLAEAMGNEILLTCALADAQELMVRAHASEQVPVGSIRYLSFDFSQASFFDAHTGDAILLNPLSSDAAHQVAL